MHWRVFVEETPLFFLFVAAHYLLIRLSAAKFAHAPCVLHLTAAHAFSPFFQRFSRAFLSDFFSVPDAAHSLKDGIVVIMWHAASLWALYAARKHLSAKTEEELPFALATRFLPRAAASLASLFSLGFLPLLLNFLLPKGFLVMQHAFPQLFQAPLHAPAAALPWCLWTYFTAIHAHHLHSDALALPLHLPHLQPPSHVQQSERQQSRNTSRDVFLLLDHAISLSSGLLRRVRSSLLWLLLCSVLFSWAFYSSLDTLDIVGSKWAIDPSTQQLHVNTTAVGLPYAIFHKFPHPSALPIQPYQAGLPHASGNNTPIVCSIEVHK
jgi:hypothetical protein